MYIRYLVVFFFKQKTAYELRISDWSSDVCSSDRLNFKRGETFSKIFKGIHDLELKYGDTGVFVRGKYWYDFELKDEHRLYKDISDSNRKEGAQSSGGKILEAFIYHNYAIGDQPGSVRQIGRASGRERVGQYV